MEELTEELMKVDVNEFVSSVDIMNKVVDYYDHTIGEAIVVKFKHKEEGREIYFCLDGELVLFRVLYYGAGDIWKCEASVLELNEEERGEVLRMYEAFKERHKVDLRMVFVRKNIKRTNLYDRNARC